MPGARLAPCNNDHTGGPGWLYCNRHFTGIECVPRMRDQDGYMSFKARQRIITPVLLGLGLLNLVIVLVAAYTLYTSHQQAVAQARITTQNLTHTLESHISAVVDKIDLVLLATVDKLQSQRSPQRARVADINEFLQLQRQRVPELTALRVVDEKGDLIYGAEPSLLGRTNYANGEQFRWLREHPKAGLFIAKPARGKLIDKWLLSFARRINKADGTFGGAVFGPIEIDYFNQLFTSIDVGSAGSIGLRDTDLALIARSDLSASIASIGDKKVAAAFEQALRANPKQGTYSSGGGGIDRLSRTHSYRRFEKYPFYIVVGVAEKDYLTPWRKDVLVDGFMVLGFVLASVVLGWSLIRSMRNLQQSEAQVQRLTRLYAAMIHCNQAILQCANEDELFPRICHDAVTLGGLKMAWIGVLDAPSHQIKPIASFGDDCGYLDAIDVTSDASKASGRGPVGTAMRENRPAWMQDILHDPNAAPWHERARQCGWAATGCVPLRRFGAVVAILALYSDTVNAFDQAQRDLLVEMGANISLALERFHHTMSRNQDQVRIEQLAHFDQLTGLPNQALLQEHFKYAVSLAQHVGEQLAVMVLDLDHFKVINDTFGRGVGDQVLIELAQRLLLTLREQDCMSRQGGDEFTFILPDLDVEQAGYVAARLIAALSKPCLVGTHELVLTGSIGIALYPEDGHDLDSLTKNAEAAMYRVKEISHNDFGFFAPQMQADSARLLQLSNALHQALANNQFSLHYQPQIAVTDGRVCGAEVLLRWQHPELGVVSPTEFIPVAESTGLIIPIGEWVLRSATSQVKVWLDQGLPAILIAVNLSAVQFRHPNLLKMVTDALAQAGLASNQLELELTEAAAMHDPAAAVVLMDRLHDRGIRMAIDDFGTGYSSLSYLKRFNVHKLKIDQSFVRDLCTDADDKAIVTAIINMARGLGIRTSAEGVQSAEQLALLRLQGCDEVQGSYFSPSLAAPEFEAYLRAHG